MTIFATWVPSDTRFAFSLSAGEHRLTNAQHAALLAAQSLGVKLSPDAVTGFPVAVESVSERAQMLYDVQVRIVNDVCQGQIISGFWSSALGAAFFYDSQVEDQLNLTGIIQTAAASAYPCRDEQGVKVFRDHSAAQLQQVGDDFIQLKLQLLQKANVLKQALDTALAALDLSAIAAVVWESESV
ncbi:hypothetical protein [Pseudomonas viridiflava]|uniref:DUF4376 domain-containing protein n=1 Tax=Pseudomonas viridiflava TaxID=33069 RepID=UPI000F05DB86|nr:hypothetical protein [Pseudomonas viridiflava]